MTSKEQRKQWEAEQKTLAALRVQEDLLDWSCSEDGFPDLHRVAGVDVSFFADGTYAIATVVVLSFPQLKVLWERSAAFRLSVPYVPGFLAFREVPALAQLMDSVPCALKPQVVLVDGNGAFHPRGCGAATHLGITVDLPTIGVAKDVLKVGEVNSSLARRVSLTLAPGQWASLCEVAALFRPRTDPAGMGKPLVVSPGHRISLETALQLTRAICGTSAPEPVRQADLRSRRAVKAWHAGQEATRVEYLSNPRLRHLERVQAVQELAEQGEWPGAQ
ncbi:Endonuclease V [Durusdinium trenchii]|uniref:Endonuclease V n=1 Tax=Durusdinium trenchii TaxID=1381693 RepID=A0ABP0LP49_9DINO